MFETLYSFAPLLFLFSVVGGTAGAIYFIRWNTQRKISALADYAEEDVETDKLLEDPETVHLQGGRITVSARPPRG
jgi:hypothetical protein